VRELDSLVRDAAAGDRLAFERLLDGDVHPAYRAALSILRSPEEARDVVQEAAIQAWQQLPQLRDPGAWPAWFRRITLRLALDERRHARHAREIPLMPELDLRAADPTATSDDAARLLSAFAQLSAPERALIALRYQLDMSVPEVADALRIPVGTAKSRLSRTIARLRHEVGDDDG
jgi:RNA polymerase sigma-70 factor (ECF subfamily)